MTEPAYKPIPMEAMRTGLAGALEVRASEVKAEVNTLRDRVTLRLEAVKQGLDQEDVTRLAALVARYGLEVNIRADFDRQSIVIEAYKKNVFVCSEEAGT